MSTPAPTSPAELERQVERETTRELRGNPTLTFAVRLSARAQKGIDRVYDEVVKKGVNFACAKGCSYCCSLKVEAYPQEAFRIARELSTRTDREAIMTRLAAHVQRHREVTGNRGREPCPFLAEGGACSIYEVRPLACRMCVSLDVQRCRQMTETVPSDEDMVYKSQAIASGTQKAYARNKLPATPHEMVASVLTAMTDPGAEQRWWNGEDVFAA